LLEIYRTEDRNRYCEKLNRRIKASLTHIREIVRLLAKHSLIQIKPNHKIKRLALTERGKRVAALLQEIKLELDKTMYNE